MGGQTPTWVAAGRREERPKVDWAGKLPLKVTEGRREETLIWQAQPAVKKNLLKK